MGVILVWRLDSRGAYQLLRKFRKDDLDGLNIMALQVHPDRSKAQIMVFAEPSFLRLYNLSSYKPQASFSGAYVNGSFSRAVMSADGRYVMSGTEDSRIATAREVTGEVSAASLSSSNKPARIKIWDSQSGNLVTCPLSDISMPYAIRAISWNKHQHMIAVAMAGQGASVAIYTAEKESVLKVLERAEQTAASDYFSLVQQMTDSGREQGGGSENDSNFNDTMATDTKPLLQNRTLGMSAASGSSSPPGKQALTAEERKAKTQEIMMRMRERKQKAVAALATSGKK